MTGSLPCLWGHRRGEMVALADRQVTEPALGVTGLADVQQPGTGNVHTVEDLAGNGCRIRSRRAGQELTNVMREPVAAILPSQNALSGPASDWMGTSADGADRFDARRSGVQHGPWSGPGCRGPATACRGDGRLVPIVTRRKAGARAAVPPPPLSPVAVRLSCAT
jgi:hypothetical protein